MNFTSTITARLMCMPMCMCQTIHVSPVSCAQKVRKPKTSSANNQHHLQTPAHTRKAGVFYELNF